MAEEATDARFFCVFFFLSKKRRQKIQCTNGNNKKAEVFKVTKIVF